MPAGHKSSRQKQRLSLSPACRITPYRLRTTYLSQRSAPNFRGNSPQSSQTPPTLPHSESARWHCAARREITERSEEAPKAKAAQPSRNDEIRKTFEGYTVEVESYDNPAGSSGGSAEGASEGRQPLTGPLCRLPRRQCRHERLFRYFGVELRLLFQSSTIRVRSLHKSLVLLEITRKIIS